jgi:hypothetical protein
MSVRRFPLYIPHTWVVLAVAAAVLLLGPAVPARADAGPKPSMRFTFQFDGDPISIVSGQLMECQDEACADAEPLQELGPQRLTCTETDCSSIAYGYAPYHKLVIEFADGTRESNVFTKKAYMARYQVNVSEDGLLVEERRSIGRLCCPSLFVTLALETLVAGSYLGALGLSRSALGWVPIASVLSLPAVWYLFPRMGLPDGWALGLGEGFAVLFEAGFIYLAALRSVPLRHVAILSVAMNAASFLAGLLM